MKEGDTYEKFWVSEEKAKRNNQAEAIQREYINP